MLPQEDPNTEYDQSLFNNTEWVDVKQAAQMTGVGDRQVRNISDRFAWPKKYAKKDGKPYLFIMKSSVEEYLKSKQTRPADLMSAPLPENSDSTTQERLNSNTVHNEPHQPDIEFHKQSEPEIEKPSTETSGSLTTEANNRLLKDIQNTQKEILDRMAKLETSRAGGAEEGYWKLKSEAAHGFNMRLLIVTCLFLTAGTALGVTLFNNNSRLVESNTKLSEELRDKKTELSTLQSVLNKLQPVLTNTVPEHN